MRATWMIWLVCLLGGCVAVPGRESTAAAPPADGYFARESGLAMTSVAPAPEAASLSVPPQATAAGAARQVIYTAALRLVVVSAGEALASIQALAVQVGGHLQESDTRSITVRVPAQVFEDVLARIASLGEAVERSVRAADVTEELQDLEIRLENARRARARLLEHLERSQSVEDTLKIELELARVSGEIESMEGRQRSMQSQIALSTIRVELNAATPRGGVVDALGLPFEWIARLGDGLLAGTVQAQPRKPRFLSKGPRFDPPAEFVRYYESGDLVEAMSADGLRLKLQEQDNYDKGALLFWHQLARRALVESRALAVTEERQLGDGRSLLLGRREVGGQVHGYLLVLVRTAKDVYSFEAWGPLEAFERQVDALIASAESLRP